MQRAMLLTRAALRPPKVVPDLVAWAKDVEAAAVREPGFRVDPEWVREVRREAVEAELQAVEDYEYRAPVGEGSDWMETE
jgi:hypothetical protein